MISLRLATIALTAALVPASAILAQNGTGTPTPPPTRPGGGGTGGGTGGGAGGTGGGGAGEGTRGPRVPGSAREGQREFRGGEGRGGLRGPGGMEDRQFMQALDTIGDSLKPDQKTRIDSIKAAYKKEMEGWQTKNGEALKTLQKSLQEARKAGEKPDPAVIDQLEKLNATRPKFDETRKQITAILTPEQSAALKSALESAAKDRKDGADRPGRREKGGDGMDDKGAPPSKGDRPGHGKAPPPPPSGDKTAPPPPPAKN